MDRFDVRTYFKEHPDRWMMTVAAAGLGALVCLRKMKKSEGFFHKLWHLMMFAAQLGAIAGLVRMKQQGEQV